MMISQGSQTFSPEDSFARLSLVADIVILGVVFLVAIAGRRGMALLLQSFTYLFRFGHVSAMQTHRGGSRSVALSKHHPLLRGCLTGAWLASWHRAPNKVEGGVAARISTVLVRQEGTDKVVGLRFPTNNLDYVRPCCR